MIRQPFRPSHRFGLPAQVLSLPYIPSDTERAGTTSHYAISNNNFIKVLQHFLSVIRWVSLSLSRDARKRKELSEHSQWELRAYKTRAPLRLIVIWFAGISYSQIPYLLLMEMQALSLSSPALKPDFKSWYYLIISGHARLRRFLAFSEQPIVFLNALIFL